MGTWKKREAGLVEYVNIGLVNCILCGKMIPRDIWVAIYNEKKLNFCDAKCENIYSEYWIPKYSEKKL